MPTPVAPIKADPSKEFETLIGEIHDSFPGSEMQKRMFLAVTFGYYDAKTMVYFRETFGLALADQLPVLRRKFPDAEVPYMGLKGELLAIGKKASSADAELAELRSYDLF